MLSCALFYYLSGFDGTQNFAATDNRLLKTRGTPLAIHRFMQRRSPTPGIVMQNFFHQHSTLKGVLNALTLLHKTSLLETSMPVETPHIIISSKCVIVV